MENKICTKCKTEKLFAEFAKAKNTADGYQHWCKICRKRYYEENKVQCLEKARKYREGHKDSIRESRKHHRDENKVSISEKRKLARKKNPERTKELARQSYLRNQDKNIERRKEYYEKNKKIINEKSREYQLKNLDDIKAKKQEYRERNIERIKNSAKEYRENNKEKIAKCQRKYREEHYEHLTHRFREYYKNNKPIFLANNSKRQAMKIQAIPAWADLDKIKSFYKEAKRLTLETGIKHVVDHIVPLRSETVRGLHTHNNLRVVTHEENARKSNKLIEELLDE